MSIRNCGKCLLWLLLLSSNCCAEIFIFGDSLSDTGNTYEATTSSFVLPDIPNPDQGYFQGRFSNGPVWIEYVAAALGEPLPVPSRLGGTNFAHGGSAVLESGFLQPSLTDQVANVSSVDPSDWCIIWGGANDLLDVDLGDLVGAVQTAADIADVIENIVDDLHSRGARQFIVVNVPALGRVPLSVATLNSQELTDLNSLSEILQLALMVALENARQNNPGIQIIEFDAFGLFEMVANDPASYGFTNVVDSAAPFDPFDFLFPGLATDLPPPDVNVDEYLFYDGLHPTAVTHLVLADEVESVINSVAVDDFNILRGMLISGDLPEVQESDDSYLKYNPGLTLNPSEPPVWIEFDGTLPTDSPTSLSVTLEASANTPNIAQTIEAFNWLTGQYEQVDSQAASFNNDSVVTVDLTADIVKYVESGTGTVTVRTGWKSGGLVLQFPWTICIDQVVWTITE
jgi:phospholipase/lecithinase/hemolysin